MVDGDHCRPVFTTGSQESVIIWMAGNVDPLPAIFNDFHPGARGPFTGSDEMPGEPQAEFLDLADTTVAREGIDGVLLRVGGQHVAVVPVEVRAGEVAP